MPKDVDPTNALQTNPTRPRAADATVGINVAIPYDLHRKLRIKAIQLDLTLVEAVTAAVETWVQ